MLIVCPSCATVYSVEPATLLPDGRNVRCARCRVVWRAEPSQSEKLLAAAAALAPELGAAEFSAGAASEEAATFAAGGSPPRPARDEDWPEMPNAADAARPDAHSTSPDDGLAGGGDSLEVDAPSIAPTDLDEGRAPIDIDGERARPQVSDHHESMDVRAARPRWHKAAGSRHFWSLSRLQVAILVLIILDAILVGWRKDIVRLLPQTASLYAAMGMPVNLRGLTFEDVTTSTQTYQNVPILVVTGKIVNATGGEVEVPRLKLILRNAAKQDVYSWTAAPPQAGLPAHDAVGFLARLASPPSDSRDVLVRFLDRRDLVAPSR